MNPSSSPATEIAGQGPRLDDLTPLLERSGPFATVVLARAEPSEDASEQTELRWRELRLRLVEQGAPEAVADAVGERLLEDRGEDRGQHQAIAVVASHDGVELVERHLEAPPRDLARWSPIPSLGLIVEWRQLTPPHLVVLTDRTGADISVVGDGAARLEIEGDDNVINKPAAGGWSERRIQARAHDSWERNAAQVAERVAALADAIHARTVVISGDPRASTMLVDELPETLAQVTQVVAGDHRAPGSGDIDTDVLHLVANAAAEDTVRFLEQFKQELGRHERAVEGAEATLAALSQAQVGVLAAHDDPSDERMAWCAEAPEHVALEGETLRSMGSGAGEPQMARLVDVAIRSAILTGASVRMVPWHGGPRDGIGGLLRWS